MRDILLLAERHDLLGLSDILRRENPAVTIKGVSDLGELQAATAEITPGLRLVCFCTGVIVPAAVLHKLQGPSYNFHPGPPDYRGIYPAVFAIHAAAQTFGATAHEISDKVDDGAIVGVDTVAMPENIDRLNLEALSRQLVTDLFIRLAPQLIGLDSPLPRADAQWSGGASTRKDFEALCLLPEDVTAEEFERRYRALGEGPEHAIRLQRFGRRFTLDPAPGDGHIYKGGQAIGSDTGDT